MKVQIKSALKSNFNKFRCIEQNQIVYPIGNNLCIFEIGKSQGQFISLHKQTIRLYDFVVSPNNRYIITAQHNNNGIDVCSYTIQNQRKNVRLSDTHNFMPMELIQNIELITDQFQSSVVYVISRNKAQACITLVDIFKQKIIAHGFVSQFNQANSCSEQTYQISLSGKNFIKRLKAADGAWIVQQRLPKKLNNYQINIHKWLPLARFLMATKTTAYIVEQNNILQTLNVTNQEDPMKQIIKIAKGFIIFTQKGKIILFSQEGDQGLYAQIQQLKLNIEKHNKISQVEYNKKNQQIFIACNNGKFYRSHIEQTGAAGKQNYFNFQEFNLNYSPQLTGSVTTTAGQSYCLISSQKNAQLWDINKQCATINLQTNNIGQQKVIKSSSLNPDGHSLCIGFSDRVRFYRILLNKFKQFGESPIKNTSLIQYSHGGQLIALLHGKGTNSSLTVMNTLSLKQVMTFKLGYKPSQAIWNEHDDQIYVSGQENKVVSVYQISNKLKKAWLQFESQISFIRYDYLTKRLIVSTGPQIYLINSQHNTENKIKPKIQNFDYIFPIQGMYLAADKKGGLYCSSTLQFEKYTYYSLFMNERFNLIYRKGILIAFSSPSNVILLRVKLNNQSNKIQIQQNVVLVQKDEINKFFDKIKLLEGNLDQLQSSVSIKLQEQRKKYFQSIGQNEKIFKNQINFLQKRLSEIQVQKNRQQKSNAKVFQQLETGQVRNVNDLEKIYDMKLKIQKQKTLTLEQQKLQQKMKYQNIIKNLQQKHSNDIQKVRKQYSDKLTKQIKQMQNEKQRHLQYKRKAETKLIDLEEQGQIALYQVQMNKDNQIKNLSQRLIKFQRENDAKIIALHNMEEAMKQLQSKYNQSLSKITKNQRLVQQNINKVSILEKQIQKKNKIIEQKNVIIQQQQHQIDGLEKAKYVLSFRTTEVRKQLEPKQVLIQKLKNQMFKLDQEYRAQVKKNFDLQQKLQKLQKISINYKKQNNDIKTQLKNKQRVHNDLCYEIFYLVNNTDQKQWNSVIIKIYQNYIKEDKLKLKGQKNDDSTSQQINRHLIHVEQSLHQVATGNEKMLKGKQQQVMRKMKENAELVQYLNEMKKQMNKKVNDITQKDIQISRLKRQLNQSSRLPKSTRANTAITGGTRRLVSRDAANQNSNADWVDLSIKRQSDYLLPDKNRKSRVFSAHKTMFWKDQGRKQKSRISDLARQLQSAKNTIMRQDRMIQQLNQRLLGLPQQHFAN